MGILGPEWPNSETHEDGGCTVVPHLCRNIPATKWGAAGRGALGLQVAWAASFEEVREHPHLYMTSTGPEETPEKSTSSPTAMRAVEKLSPPTQCYSPEPRNHPCLSSSFSQVTSTWPLGVVGELWVF